MLEPIEEDVAREQAEEQKSLDKRIENRKNNLDWLDWLLLGGGYILILYSVLQG